MEAVIFARVSSREQEEGYSLDAQISNLRGYSKAHNLIVIKEFVIVESSTRGDRKKFYEMIKFVQSQRKKIAIVCDKVDRLQRTFNEMGVISELLDQDKIELHFRGDNSVITRDSNSNEKMMWQARILFASSYVNAISDNVKRSQKEMMKKGVWGHQAPIGYLNVRDESGRPTIIIDPKNGPLIKKLFEMYSAGIYGGMDILKESRRLHLLSKHGKNLGKQAIFNVLSNPFYCGKMYWKGSLYSHNYERLISTELFEKCQEVMHSKHHHKVRKYRHVFQKLLVCKKCDHIVTTDVKIKNGKTYKYLFCPHCGARVNENEGLNIVKRVLNRLKEIPQAFYQSLISRLEKELNNEHKLERLERSRLERQLMELDVKSNRLLDVYLTGDIIQDIYQKKTNEIELERQKLREELGQYDSVFTDRLIDIKSLISLVSNAFLLFEISNFDEKRLILKSLFSKLEMEGKSLIFSISKPVEILFKQAFLKNGDPNGTRTRVDTLRGCCPNRLDDRVFQRSFLYKANCFSRQQIFII